MSDSPEVEDDSNPAFAQRARARALRWAPGKAWNFFIIFLSIFVIFALIYQYAVDEEIEAIRLMQWGDSIACIFFFWDVILRWLASPNRLKFWIYGWIDLISSIPNLQPLRIGRLVTILRIIRGVRALRAGDRVSNYFFSDKRKGAFAASGTLLFASIAVCGFLVLKAESSYPDSKIKTAEDAFWWSINVVTTVGAGNECPISPMGKGVSMVLMFTGISLFSINTAIFSSWIVGNQKDCDFLRELLEKSQAESDALRVELEELKKKSTDSLKTNISQKAGEVESQTSPSSKSEIASKNNDNNDKTSNQKLD